MVLAALQISLARAQTKDILRQKRESEDSELLVKCGGHYYKISKEMEDKFRRAICASPYSAVSCKIEGGEEAGGQFILVVHIQRPMGATRVAFPVRKCA